MASKLDAAMEYERRNSGQKRLDQFFESSVPRLKNEEVRGWADALVQERQEFWRTIGSVGERR